MLPLHASRSCCGISRAAERSIADQPSFRARATAFSGGRGGSVQDVQLGSEEPVQQKVQEGWDPEGLFRNASRKPEGLIATRQQSRRKDPPLPAPSIAAEHQARLNGCVCLYGSGTQYDQCSPSNEIY